MQRALLGRMLKSLRQWLWNWRGVLVITPTLAGLVILVRFAGLLQAWEWAAYDQLLRLRPTEPVDDRVVIVGLTEADVTAIGQSIVPDGVYAKLLEQLRAQKPRAIGLDIYRDLPVEPGHQKLVNVFESTPNLVGIRKVVGERGVGTIAAPPALAAKGQIASNDTIIDADSKVRRGLIYLQDDAGQTVYSFGLYLSLLYLEAQGVKPQVVETVPPGQTPPWRLGKTLFQPLDANFGGYIRTEEQGYQVMLNYRSTPRHFATVSVMDVLNNRVPKDWARDRVVLIGAMGESFQDFFFTPYSSSLLSLPERMAGVEVHAHLVSQLISAALDDRPLIQTWKESTEWLWILVWSSVGSLLAWQLRYGSGQWKAEQILLPSVALVGLLGSTYGALVMGYWIPLVPPLVALVGSAVAVTAYIARSAGDIRKTFGRYVSDEVVATLLEDPEGLKLGGDRRKITILTSDLRGFTALSERIPPEDVVKLLNIYLEAMTEVISSYQGTIIEFMGDGIFVLFGAPVMRPDDAERAIACAVAMQLSLRTVNEKLQPMGFPKLAMGIGLNTGEAVVGNIGSLKRSKYGAIGGQVNLAFRIESYTLEGQILISETTLDEVRSLVTLIGQQQVQPKGVIHPITIYEVGSIAGRYQLSLPSYSEQWVVLPEPLTLYYAQLEGKHVGDEAFQGNLVQLSERRAKIRIDPQSPVPMPEPLTNLKLNLREATTGLSEDIYVKVLNQSAEPHHFFVQFSSIPPTVDVMLKKLYQTLLEANPKP